MTLVTESSKAHTIPAVEDIPVETGDTLGEGIPGTGWDRAGRHCCPPAAEAAAGRGPVPRERRAEGRPTRGRRRAAGLREVPRPRWD